MYRGSTHETISPHRRTGNRRAGEPGNDAGAQGAPITVRFTVQPKTLVTTLVELAVEKGFFKDAGIDARTVTVAHGPAAVTALASGSVDVATNAPEVFLALAGKGQSIKLIAGQTRQLGVFASRPGLDLPANFPDSVRALKGKKIGVTALSSATQYLSITMLNSAGLDATDVEFIAVGTGAPQALSARPHRRRVPHRAADRDLAHARRAHHDRPALEPELPGATEHLRHLAGRHVGDGRLDRQEPRGGRAHPQGDRQGRRVPA